MENTEIKIIKQCKKGQLDKFTLLYDKHIKSIYDFIYYKTYHKETAEDLTSQTFIKALEKISSYDQTKGKFNSWLYKIAQNTVIDFYRQKKDEQDIEDIWDLAANQDIETDIDAQKQLNEVRQYLKKIQTKHRDIIIMRLWQQLSYQEISEITGLSEANCKMIYSRTINKLRQQMPLASFLLLLFLNINQ